MMKLPTSWLWLVASFTLPIAIAVGFKTIVRWQHPSSPTAAQLADCQTIIADPKPPINVRSSPIAAANNVVGRLPNGVPLSVTGENQGWLKISSPLQGWVYQELTVTSCGSMGTAIAAQPPSESGTHLMAIATQQYQAGNLDGAIALAKAVPAHSPIYPVAIGSVSQWQTDWQRAESNYYSAQKDLRDGRWNDVLSRVEQYPNIRFWKEKLAVLVKQAIAQQRLSQSNSQSNSQNKKEAITPPSQNPN